jgi:hypothetical protein
VIKARMVVKRVAVIGLGPAGAISIDALAQEEVFDVIRVFERREAAGGCWIGDLGPPPRLEHLSALASRSADKPLPIPRQLPARVPPSSQPRFAESSVYPYLETNVDFLPMQFSQEPISTHRSEWSRKHYGDETPFRHWTVMQRYIQRLVNRRGYEEFVSYSTSVELAKKVGKDWVLTLRKSGETEDEPDYWWQETFDAVLVASGHYNVPYVPSIPGLDALEKRHPGTVLHSKQFRGRHLFKGKRVVVVGASVSAADIAFDLASTATSALPVHAVMLGHAPNVYFGDEAFNHPHIAKRPSILSVVPATRTVALIDGTKIAAVDHIIFGTGYSWSLPFLPNVDIRNNRVPRLYQHIVWNDDPTLLFIGAVSAGLTFKVFEWQAVLAARLLAGRASLPPLNERLAWEEERIRRTGDGTKFTLIFPDFEQYFEDLRRVAGPGDKNRGRQLPAFDQTWVDRFLAGHERRKRMWRDLNRDAEVFHEAEPPPTTTAVSIKNGITALAAARL